MALYDVEISDVPRTPKAINFVCSLSKLSEREIYDRLQFHPLVIKNSLPLTEAISLERELKKLGVMTTLVRVIERDESPESEFIDLPENDNLPTEIPDDEIIEITEKDIKVLHPYKSIDHISEFKRRRIWLLSSWKGWFGIAALLAAVALISWYALIQSRHRLQEIEIEAYIAQWQNTLEKQEMTLDRGTPPERIFYKLDEIQGTIERMLTLIKSLDKATALRTQFTNLKSQNGELLRDLAFRLYLEDDGYPIHPICLVDRGMVQGFSDLPESTLLRIRLFGQGNIDSHYYAVRISGGAFRMIIDPVIEKNVFDADATVAPFSQQPPEIQRWAERKFLLSEKTEQRLPRSAFSIKDPRVTEIPAQTSLEVEAQPKPVRSSIILNDPGSDRVRGQEIETSLNQWEATVLAAHEHVSNRDFSLIGEIYKRLLKLEVRINQLLGLLESTEERNIWIERREETYGNNIALRGQIEALHEEQPIDNNPFILENRLRDHFHQEGYTDAQVLVVDSPQIGNGFVVEIEIGEGKKEAVFAIIARIVAMDINDTDIQIDRINLHFKGDTYRWTPDQILQADEMLGEENGHARCASFLDICAETL